MAQPSARELTQLARSAGYQVVELTQLRTNRWMMLLQLPDDTTTLVLIQIRPLIGAADIQDLAEVMRLRRPTYGLIYAPGGALSPAAQQTLTEIGDKRIRFCTVLPAARTETIGISVTGAALKQVP